VKSLEPVKSLYKLVHGRGKATKKPTSHKRVRGKSDQLVDQLSLTEASSLGKR
jgi:hypothetical protein